MPITQRVRFSKTAQKPSTIVSHTPLSLNELDVTKRLSGFCLAPAHGRAATIDDRMSMREAMRTLKPSLDWQDNDTSRNLDLIVGNGVLQGAYSEGGNWRAVQACLTRLLDRLAPGGRLVLRENALLLPEQMVLLELPDWRAKIGEDDAAQFTVQRLMDYAAAARPWLAEDLRGFFLEEVPALRAHTRLFRLPMKWAAEFLLRKDLKDNAWNASFAREYILGSERTLRTQILGPSGLRVLVNAPHWNDDQIERTYQLYSDDGSNTKLSPPPSDIVLVLQKSDVEDSLLLSEQKARTGDARHLTLNEVQNERTGDMMTVVTGLEPTVQVLPWTRLGPDAIGVYVRPDAVRPLSNIMARKTRPIDGRRFSGFLPEPLQMRMSAWDVLEQKGGVASIARWLSDETGLDMASGTDIVEGKLNYPAPDFIDQAISTVFIETTDHNATNDMICFEASDLLQAIHAGLVPSATLEAQLWQLARHAGVALKPLVDRVVDLPFDPDSDKLKVTTFEALCRKLADDENQKSAQPFRTVRGYAGDWRIARSVFVEESNNGPQRAHEHEFVLNDDEPLHRAALMCLSRSMSGDTLAGFEMVDCPVPTRYGKPGKMIRMPSIPLPTHLRSVPEARQWVAEQLKLDPKHVVPCGEAVFTHIGVTPQKIFPFMVTRMPRQKFPKMYQAPIKHIKWITDLDNSDSFLWKWGLALALLCDGSEISMVNNWAYRAEETSGKEMKPATLRIVGKGLER